MRTGVHTNTIHQGSGLTYWDVSIALYCALVPSSSMPYLLCITFRYTRRLKIVYSQHILGRLGNIGTKKDLPGQPHKVGSFLWVAIRRRWCEGSRA